MLQPFSMHKFIKRGMLHEEFVNILLFLAIKRRIECIEVFAVQSVGG